MIAGIIGLILGFLVLMNGFSALRRPLDQLVKFDPIGKRVLESKGEKTTLRMYRAFGLVLVLLGMVTVYLSINFLMGR
jgi:hypothetical protein